MTIFPWFFWLGGSANLAEGSAEPVGPKLTDGSAEPARLGRSLEKGNCKRFWFKYDPHYIPLDLHNASASSKVALSSEALMYIHLPLMLYQFVSLGQVLLSS